MRTHQCLGLALMVLVFVAIICQLLVWTEYKTFKGKQVRSDFYASSKLGSRMCFQTKETKRSTGQSNSSVALFINIDSDNDMTTDLYENLLYSSNRFGYTRIWTISNDFFQEDLQTSLEEFKNVAPTIQSAVFINNPATLCVSSPNTFNNILQTFFDRQVFRRLSSDSNKIFVAMKSNDVIAFLTCIRYRPPSLCLSSDAIEDVGMDVIVPLQADHGNVDIELLNAPFVTFSTENSHDETRTLSDSGKYQYNTVISSLVLDEEVKLQEILGDSCTINRAKKGVEKTEISEIRRVVVALTTTKKRFTNIFDTIKSIFNQSVVPNALYLTLSFPITTEEKQKLSKYNVTILPCKDYGPATKLLPVLLIERSPTTEIVTVDDDMAYNPLLIETLLSARIKNPYAAIGFAGQQIDELDYKVRSAVNWRHRTIGVDILEAFLGALYLRSFFDDDIFQVPQECWTTDDIWISAHLARKRIPRVKLANSKRSQHATFTRNDAIEPRRAVNSVDRNNVCANFTLESFRSQWLNRPRPCPMQYYRI